MNHFLLIEIFAFWTLNFFSILKLLSNYFLDDISFASDKNLTRDSIFDISVIQIEFVILNVLN